MAKDALLVATGDPSGLDDLVALAPIDFGIFVELMFPILHQGKGLDHAPYIDLIIEELVRSRRGGHRRIIINLPPGFMKSMLVSILHVAWRLGVNPAEKIICISYGDDLAHDLSRKTRRLMLSPLYRKIFPGTILDKKAEDSITTTKGGQRYATAVGSDIAGFRADLIVIDDPMQPDEVASELAKERLRTWYYGVVAQRLLDQSAGVIVLVMHRLAPDDLTATLMEVGGWQQLSLPLIAEQAENFVDHRKRVLMQRRPGDPLNPARSPIEACEKLKRDLPPHVFDAQYQQRPRYGGSGYCSIDRLIRFDQKPKFELTVHSWDIAATKGGGDWTVCTKFGLARDEESGDVMYLIGIIRMQIELPDVRDAIITQDVADKPALIVMDGNGIGVGVYQDLTRRGLTHITPGSAMEKVNAANLKAERFRRALMNLYDGRVRIPASMPGLEILLAELATFPDGKNDDQVDSLSLVGANLNRVIAKARRRSDTSPDRRGYAGGWLGHYGRRSVEPDCWQDGDWTDGQA
jgi:predicted phage terminase large subunit-like protein